MNGTLAHEGDYELSLVMDGSYSPGREYDGDTSLELTEDGRYGLSREAEGDMSLELTEDGDYGNYIPVEIAPRYTDTRVITPTESIQLLYTRGKVIPGNIRVNAIPSNWGKITWDGYRLIVE